MKYKWLLSIAVMIAVAFSSCRTAKTQDLVYFTNVDSLQVQNIKNSYAMKIKPDDELLIRVTSEVPAATDIYNLPVASVSSQEEKLARPNEKIATYTVTEKGTINMPVLGEIAVVGKTVDQLQEYLTAEIGKTVEHPIVSVNLKNVRVVVLGEVANPGTKEVIKQRYSLMDAIGDAGGLTQYGRRDNVLLLREEEGKVTTHRINLQDANTLYSPYYYLQQNDIVIVEGNNIKEANAKYNTNNAYKLTVVSTIVSAVSVIASLAIALLR